VIKQTSFCVELANMNDTLAGHTVPGNDTSKAFMLDDEQNDMSDRDDIQLLVGTYTPPMNRGHKPRQRRPSDKSHKIKRKVTPNKTWFKQWVLQRKPELVHSDCRSLINEELLCEITIEWLFKWSSSDHSENNSTIDQDSLLYKSSLVLFSLGFPKEIVPAIRERIFESKPVMQTVLFTCKNFLYNLGRIIELSDIEIQQKPLGRGAGGVVYVGTWVGIPVAVKFFKEKNIWLVPKRDFRYELTLFCIFGSFRHFIPCLGANYKEGFLVMPLAQRGSLSDLLQSGKLANLGWNKKNAMLWSVANAVRSLHRYGIMHRDLKPQNILVDASYHCYLTDFGMSRYSSDRKRSKTMNVGTTPYMAPEVLSGNGFYDHSVDAFSFGVILWQVVAGEVSPYSSISSFNIPDYVISGNRMPIPTDAPDYLSTLISECWASDPKTRPTFDEIVARLAAHFDGLEEDSIQPV
jgi:predicted Ser/Thr protein kinase